MRRPDDQTAAALLGGVERIRAELVLHRDAMEDFNVVPPDQETLSGYIRGFYIMLSFITANSDYTSDFIMMLDQLSTLCSPTESEDSDDV